MNYAIDLWYFDIILDATWFLSNQTIHTDLIIPSTTDLFNSRFYPNLSGQALSYLSHQLNRQLLRVLQVIIMLKDYRK